MVDLSSRNRFHGLQPTCLPPLLPSACIDVMCEASVVNADQLQSRVGNCKAWMSSPASKSSSRTTNPKSVWPPLDRAISGYWKSAGRKSTASLSSLPKRLSARSSRTAPWHLPPQERTVGKTHSLGTSRTLQNRAKPHSLQRRSATPSLYTRLRLLVTLCINRYLYICICRDAGSSLQTRRYPAH